MKHSSVTWDTAATFLCISYLYPIKMFKQSNKRLLVFMYTPLYFIVFFLMKNNRFSIFLLLLLLILLIAVINCPLMLHSYATDCMHSYTFCSSSLKENKVGKQFMMKKNTIVRLFFFV